MLPGILPAEALTPRQQGPALLRDGKPVEAMEAFQAAIAADSRNFMAMHGLALCQYAANDLQAAAATLRQAIELAGDQADPAMVVNLAAVEVELDDARAALRACATYLARHEDAPDEAVLSAMGTALSIARIDHPRAPSVREAAAVYQRRIATLEAKHPGMKWWETGLIPVDEHALRSAEGPPAVPTDIPMLPLPELPEVHAVTDTPEQSAPQPAPQTPPQPQATAPAKPTPAIAIPIGPDLLVTPSNAIGDAREVRLESTQGLTLRAKVVRIDVGRKLALLKVEGRRLMYFNLGDQLEDGPVQCAVVLKPVVFNLVAEVVDGDIQRQENGWTVELEHAPRLGGSPVTKDGRIVGMAIKDANGSGHQPTVVPVNEIRGFLGRDLPRPTHLNADPRSSIYHVTIDP